ncbi:cationic peroxidase 1-like [Macadamia integrifolia]|uniref:cationic peroxidase 1-like n=1 Tax=Macadamia integrifolia TaxID=60698 RepID=UPI001C4E31CC|nr:cationic peroxidase 1-like [Macadamia integrifolia]
MASSTYFMFKLCFTIFLLIHYGHQVYAQLSPDFYSTSCPKAPFIIKSIVISAVATELRMGASLLRLHFHDCFVNGCDGSLLLDSTANFTSEKLAKPNLNSLRGFEVVDKIKSELERVCPGVVSCADILAIVARDATVVLGGAPWIVYLGRRDSTTASASAADVQLPSPFSNLSTLISDFKNKGLTPKDLVALSGSHTIGMTRCTVYRSRIYNDTNINKGYAASLKKICPISGDDSNLAPLDTTTPNIFDSAYYTNLLNFKGILHSDQALFNGGNGLIDYQVKAYTANSLSFLKDFGDSMIRMGNISPLTGSNGEIRSNCRKAN